MDDKVSSFFAKKKKKATKKPVAAPVEAVEAPVAEPAEPKKAIIQTKGKVLATLQTTTSEGASASKEADEEEAVNDANKTHWMMKPKKKTEDFSNTKKIPIHSERAFPTLSGPTTAPVVTGKQAKAPADVRSQTVWSKLADSDEED